MPTVSSSEITALEMSQCCWLIYFNTIQYIFTQDQRVCFQYVQLSSPPPGAIFVPGLPNIGDLSASKTTTKQKRTTITTSGGILPSGTYKTRVSLNKDKPPTEKVITPEVTSVEDRISLTPISPFDTLHRATSSTLATQNQQTSLLLISSQTVARNQANTQKNNNADTRLIR